MTSTNGDNRFRARNVDVLVVDDLRIFYFNPAYLGTTNISYARTSQEAITLLTEDHSWDELWLDHDLGGRDTIDPVVDHLIENPPLRIGEIYVHSMNPPARRRVMEKIADQTDYHVREVDLYQVSKMPWLSITQLT